jgi:hypothetical protein
MKNKISDLRNHMFEALERLNNDDLSPDDLEREIKRASAISEVGKVIVDSAKTEVMFMKLTGKPKKGFIAEDATEEFIEEPKKIERPAAEYSNKDHLQLRKAE